MKYSAATIKVDLAARITTATEDLSCDTIDQAIDAFQSIVEDVEHITKAAKWAFDKIDALEGDVGNLEDEVDDLEDKVRSLKDQFCDDEDESGEAIEVQNILDELKLAHLREVFDHYTLEQFETLIPKP